MAASVPMLVLMRVIQPPARPVPPHDVAMGVLEIARLRRALTGRQEVLVTTIAHLGYAATFGAAYPLLRDRLPGGVVTQGGSYGLLIWLASYWGWLPLAGILPPPWRDEPRQQAALVVGHLAWGVMLGCGAAYRNEGERLHSADQTACRHRSR